ncbi:MAG TPA: hypothetical protein V6C72_01400 [Chroococcales cyanobacterium]
MSRIAVDMDEVIADALGEQIVRYNRLFDQSVTREELHGKRLRDFVPVEHKTHTDRIVHSADFFSGLAVMDGAQEVLKKLSSQHEIFITTAAMEVPCSFDAKYQWLLEHFPFLSPMNFVFCGDKSVIRADYLIDDHARHFKHFLGEGILFDAPHNQHVTGYRRVRNWFEVDELFAKEIIPV